ncbi:hypothetical protein HHK36_010569 [Tetracentron sinense]|uniref:DUF7356 domain-containing protein n=1 Tax=Tetracentron sinense TaxID=13715 RepID=A0A835DJN7_TETSI|nr:hypothetical protein HHK36_010569 [Tetracentron sinense]
MDSKGVLTAFLLILIVAEGSDASLFGDFRRILGNETKDNPNGDITPSPSPLSGANSVPSPLDVDKSSKKSPQDPQPPNNSSKSDPKGSDSKVPPSLQTESGTDNHKNHEQGDKSNTPIGLQAATDEKCEMSKSCKDRKNLTACIRHSESGSQQSFLLVQNEGEITVKVNVRVPPFINIAFNEIEILKHQAKKYHLVICLFVCLFQINFSADVGESPTIVLNAGNGDCVLQIGQSISENFFQRFPSYATRLTPIYGAYFLFLTALIVGGTWACCKLGKRGRQGDGRVPYQELEMGQPESVSAVNVDTADGWDRGWDDDWDEEKAVKSPGGHHVGNVSANGLTSRSSNRDGWEIDWDD